MVKLTTPQLRALLEIRFGGLKYDPATRIASIERNGGMLHYRVAEALASRGLIQEREPGNWRVTSAADAAILEANPVLVEELATQLRRVDAELTADWKRRLAIAATIVDEVAAQLRLNPVLVLHIEDLVVGPYLWCGLVRNEVSEELGVEVEAFVVDEFVTARIVQPGDRRLR